MGQERAGLGKPSQGDIEEAACTSLLRGFDLTGRWRRTGGAYFLRPSSQDPIYAEQNVAGKARRRTAIDFLT